MLGQVPPEPVSGTPPTDDADKAKPSPQAQTCNMLIRGLRSAQKVSAIAFTAFAGLHLTSTIVLPALVSVDAGNAAMMAGRTLYQSTLGEPVWIYGSIFVHVATGLILHARRIYVAKVRHNRWITGFTPTITSGLILTVLAAGHIYASRVVPVSRLGDSSLINLDFIGWALKDNVAVTGSALVLLGLTYTDHAVRGIAAWFQPAIKHYRKAILGGVLALLGVSLFRQWSAPEVSEWLASQYQLAH